LPLVARSLAVALSFVLLSSPPVLQPWVGGDTRAFILVTIALAIVNGVLVWSWTGTSAAALKGPPYIDADPGVRRAALSGPPTTILTLAVAIGAGWLVVTACHAWLHQILAIPHDSQRADMLIVVQQGLQRMRQGRNPYTIYHVPWDAPLPYGPMLWAPYAIPMALRADVRFLTVAGELFVPVACAIAAVGSAARGRLAACAGCLLMLAAMCLNPDLERFASIGHTPVYWPLLALFAWLVVRERWYAAAIALGLLVVARTTMVAIVPVLLMAVWGRERGKLPGVLVLVVLAAAVPFLPFAIWDARALIYAMYGSYQNVIKGFVWTSTSWGQHTIGLTGVLLSYGLPRFVEALQELVMLAVYGASWLAMRRGRPPVAWMGLALLAFSMTTLWPVNYVYFDVFLLLAAAVIAEAMTGFVPSLGRAWTSTAAATTALVAASAAIMLPLSPSLDAGTAAARPFLRSGFTGDEREGDRTFAWVDGRHASVLLPRRTAGAAAIDMVCQPALSNASSSQQMSAVLNGTLIGTVVLPRGWNEISLTAPATAWRIGVNELELFLSSSTSPADAGTNDDHRQLSVAIDRVTVRHVVY
jgi:hypothetical protein